MFSPFVAVVLVVLFLEKLVSPRLKFPSLSYAFYGCLIFEKEKEKREGAVLPGQIPAQYRQAICKPERVGWYQAGTGAGSTGPAFPI
jgi:hypothetical protein